MADMKTILTKIEQLPDDMFVSVLSDPDQMKAVREQMYSPIRSKNVRTESGKMRKDEIESLFNVSLTSTPDNKYEVTDHNTDRQVIDRVLSYLKSRWDATPEKNRGALKEALYCFGQGEVTADPNGRKTYDNGNADWMNRICESAGISSAVPTQTPDKAQKKDDDGKPAPDPVQSNNNAQTKAQKRKQATANRPKQMPPIGAASQATNTQQQTANSSQSQQGQQGQAPNNAQSQAQGQAQLLPLQPISVIDCITIEPKRYIVDGLIEAGTITQFAGKEKIGKSYVLMHMALSMSAGNSWLGRDTMTDVQGGILWLNLDMSRALGKRRVYEIAHGIEESFDVRNPDLFKNFYMMDNQTFHDANRDNLHFFTDNDAVNGLREYIIANDIKVCFIDNLIQIEGDAQENVSTDMRTVLNRMKQLRDDTDCAFIFIHHTDKAGNRGRGSSDIFAETDLNLQLEPDTKSTNLLKLVTDGARSTASQDIGMSQEWKPRIDDNGQPMTDANGHPVFIYSLSTADASCIYTAKEERATSGRVSKTITDNIEKIKDVFRVNGNTPLSKNKIIQVGNLSGTKDTRIASIDQALTENILKTDTGLLFSLNDGII